MAYSDPGFNVTIQDSVVGSPSSGVSIGTITASATQTFTGTAGTKVNGTYRLPVFKQPVRITGIKIYCTVAAATAANVTMGFYNGTALIGSATAVGTVGAYDATLVAPTVASNGAQTGAVFFTSTNGEPVMINTCTGTASADSLGSYAIDFLWQNLFVS